MLISNSIETEQIWERLFDLFTLMVEYEDFTGESVLP